MMNLLRWQKSYIDEINYRRIYLLKMIGGEFLHISNISVYFELRIISFLECLTTVTRAFWWNFQRTGNHPIVRQKASCPMVSNALEMSSWPSLEKYIRDIFLWILHITSNPILLPFYTRTFFHCQQQKISENRPHWVSAFKREIPYYFD